MFLRKKEDPALDPRVLMVPMRACKVGMGDYTAEDRFRDFRAVLIDANATPEVAERVLFQLLELTSLHDPMNYPDLTDAQTNRMLGRREVGLDLLRFLTVSKQGVVAPTTQRNDGGE